jgi:hypothetical protein
MIVLTPQADDEVLNPKVVSGLMYQSLHTEWLIVSRPRDAVNRLWGIQETRNVLSHFAPTEGYVILMDSDVVLDVPDALERLYHATMKEQADAMILDTKQKGHPLRHKRIALACVRGETLKRLAFGGASCECTQLARVCEPMALDYEGAAHEEPNETLARQ